MEDREEKDGSRPSYATLLHWDRGRVFHTFQARDIAIVVGLFTQVARRKALRRLNHTCGCGVRGVKVLPRFRLRKKHTSTHFGPVQGTFDLHPPTALHLFTIDP